MRLDWLCWDLIHAGPGHYPYEAGINYTTPMVHPRLGSEMLAGCGCCNLTTVRTVSGRLSLIACRSLG